MRGASRVALAEATDRLATATQRPGVAATLGDELFAVVALLDGEPALRRALTDSARPAPARAGLVRDLLGSQVSRPALNLLGSLAAARWSGPADLPSAVEQLAALAMAAAAQEEGHLDDTEDELFRFGRVLAGAPDLRNALSGRQVPAELKRRLLDTLLAGKATASTLRLATEAAVHPRGRSLNASLTEYARLAAQWRQRLIAVVRVAAALSESQRERLRAALAASYGQDVHLNVIVDPGLLGGMSVRIGDEFIDGSVASRLATLRHRLAA